MTTRPAPAISPSAFRVAEILNAELAEQDAAYARGGARAVAERALGAEAGPEEIEALAGRYERWASEDRARRNEGTAGASWDANRASVRSAWLAGLRCAHAHPSPRMRILGGLRRSVPTS
jgi:hypothetical protein